MLLVRRSITSFILIILSDFLCTRIALFCHSSFMQIATPIFWSSSSTVYSLMPSPIFLAFSPDFPPVHLLYCRQSMSMFHLTIKTAISQLLAVSIPMFRVAILIFCSLARILLIGSVRQSNLCKLLNTRDVLAWSGICWLSSIFV